MKINLKSLLKAYKLNEENISMVLGAFVIVIVGILVVNYFKDKNGSTLPEALTTNQASIEKTHIVVKGETLWSIAEETYGSGYNWTDIYNLNNLKSENIEVGQQLILPNSTAKEPTSTKEVLTLDQSAKTDSPITENSYTVVHGDTLWSVSVRAYGDGYQWTKIAKANNLKNPSTIHSGNILILPR